MSEARSATRERAACADACAAQIPGDGGRTDRAERTGKRGHGHANARPSSGGRRSKPPQPFGASLRVVFAAFWIAAQIVLVLTAERRPDGAFGFRRFVETTTVSVTLSREVTVVDPASRAVRRTRVRVDDDGEWTARDEGGMSRTFAWRDRVKLAAFEILGRAVDAPYGARAVPVYWQAALDDVASHVPDDAETHRFLLSITVHRNAGEPYVVELASPERLARDVVGSPAPKGP